MNAEQPIGFFDSGIGGLTVANAVLKALPNERIIYFGDSLHFPYGEKSAKEIQSYSITIANYLLQQNCKCIVIACNTASAAAYKAVKEYIGDKAIVVDVIDPTVYYVKKYLSHIENIGVIATRSTIKSGAYAIGLKEENNKLNVASVATPLLAPMIEEGFVDDNVSKAVIEKYLSNEQLQQVEALVLACTHYPFIKTEIEEFYNNNISVIDTPTVIAEFLKDTLSKKDLLSKSEEPFSAHQFFVSELNQTIEQTAERFFDHQFQLKENNIFK